MAKIKNEKQRKAQRRSQKKWYRKHQAYRHKHHLKSSKSHLRSNKRWMRKNRGKQMLYQKKSYCKNFLKNANKPQLRDFQYYHDLAIEKLQHPLHKK